MRHTHYARSTAALLLALTLAACGGGGGGSDGDDTPTTPTAPAFKAATQTWTIALPTGTDKTVCYDFDAGAVAACDSGTTWDLKLDASSTAPTFRSNGGVTNSAGGGAAFAFFDWTGLKTWINATTDPSSGTSVAALYTADAASSIFTQKSWYAYDLEGTHLLYPNYNIYLVNADTSDTAAKTYALQIIGYYGGASGTASGYPKIRWIDRANAADVRTATIAATDNTAWVYYDLANGTVVDLTDTAAASSTAWQIAFRRFEIKLNGGTSGTGKVAGYMAKQLDGFYDADGNPVKAKFLAATPDNTLADLTANDYATPSSRAWVSDSQGSVLSPAYTGTYPGALSYGFYSYFPTASATLPAHRLEANVDEGALLRSGDGKSYARFHLSKIEYATPADATSAQTWTFEFNVQPAAE